MGTSGIRAVKTFGAGLGAVRNAYPGEAYINAGVLISTLFCISYAGGISAKRRIRV
ncbi:hypothetical protein AAHS21_27245 [Mycobacterium sp. 050272]|uniref:hypothetical protein n=1 Tax=Mycobacterium sp. 050272 TaxID=3142488 RepID=UPI003187068A